MLIFTIQTALWALAEMLLITQAAVAVLRSMLVDWRSSPPSLALVLLLGPFVLPIVIFVRMQSAMSEARAASMARKQADEPPPLDPLLLLSASELSARVVKGELSAETLTRMCINRLVQVNPQLNAVVATRFEAALLEAKAADDAVSTGFVPPDSPLWGVPCVVKECFEMPGMPYTAGIASRAGMRGERLSPAVQRVQSAGLIVVGTTNVSEGCMFHESDNPVYGRSAHPLDAARTPGGSSGGAAAAVAAACVPLAVTSDIGGSTRIPALYCGLFGHKPTGGTVPNTHSLPYVGPNSLISRFCQLGPTCRSAADLYPLLRVLAGADGFDAMVRDDAIKSLRDPLSVDVADLRVFVFEEPFLPRLLRSGFHPELRAALRRAEEALAALGCEIVHIGHKELPEMTLAFSIWAALLGAVRDEPFMRIISDGKQTPLNFFTTLVEALRCLCSGGSTARHTLPAVGLAMLENITDRFKEPAASFVKRGASLRSRLDALLNGGRSVLLTPSLLTPAPAHAENLLRFTDAAQTGIFNVMQLPATAVPMGAGACGLPLGCQIVGAARMDHLTIAVAIALQRAGVAVASLPAGPIAQSPISGLKPDDMTDADRASDEASVKIDAKKDSQLAEGIAPLPVTPNSSATQKSSFTKKSPPTPKADSAATPGVASTPKVVATPQDAATSRASVSEVSTTGVDSPYGATAQPAAPEVAAKEYDKEHVD